MRKLKKVWNKGLYNVDLIGRVNQIINSNPVRLTPGEIYRCLGKGYKYSYKAFHKHLMRARAKGLVDSNCILEGRGGNNNPSGRKFKFEVGDKVRINIKSNQIPKYLVGELKRLDVPRTITGIFSECHRNPRPDTMYYLGNNRKGGCHLLESRGFRTRELIPYVAGSAGRPKLKRRYNRNPDRVNGQCTSGEDKRLKTKLTTPPSIMCVNGKKAS